jgi:RTX calcium-binding nonapeptide repeat (4 copies)
VAGNALAGGGKSNRALVDLTDIVGVWTALEEAGTWDVGSTDSGWPTFDFVYDLRTGSILEVSALVEASTAAMMDGQDLTNPDIEPINVWAYGQSSNGSSDASSNSKLAAAGGSAGASSVFAKQPEERTGSGSGADKIPDGVDLDNWPPAGWTGFDKSDFGATNPGAFASSFGRPAGFVDNVVHYATKLIGTADDDVINGTTGNDFFNGLGGDDVLNGGPGDDAFHFMAGFGNDVVIGFTAGSAGDDIVEFRDSFTNFADVLAASRQVGPNVLIELDDSNAVALIDVALSSLNQDDFRFV